MKNKKKKRKKNKASKDVNVQHYAHANYLANRAVIPNTHGKDGAATAKNAIPNP